MTEKRFYQYIKSGLDPMGFYLDRIESFISKGIPDICYSKRSREQSFGWIELKFSKAWPKGKKSIVKLDHFTKEQRNWIYTRGKATGRVFLFWKIGEDHLMYNHEAVFTLGSCTRGELLQQAISHWHKKIDFKELAKLLIS